MRVIKKGLVTCCALILGCSLAACTALTKTAQQTTSTTSQIKETLTVSADGISQILETSADDMFTDRDLEGTYDAAKSTKISLSQDSVSIDGTGATAQGSTVTITQEGTYILQGTLTDGQIIVTVGETEKVQLVLDGVSVTNKTGAAIYVTQADKVFITLADGSRNLLANGGSYTASGEDNVDGAIFSREDLTLNGTGTLTVQAATGHGIVCKDDLKITGGTYAIDAASKGIDANDSVRITGQTVLQITSGGDAIHAENTEDAEQGYVYIREGTFLLTSGADGIDASSYIRIENGTFTINAGGGANDATESGKGIKADGSILLSDGTYDLDTSDDAIHCNGDIYIAGGTYTVQTGDDAIHADSSVTVAGGMIDVIQSHEGIEGLTIDILDGQIDITADDDGINAAGGNDQSGMAGMFGQDSFAADSESYLNIAGGNVTVNSQGDGLDANGTLYISGGTTIVYGPTNDGNGALDYDQKAQITGGTLIAFGSSGMAMNFTSASQGSILLNTGNQNAGTAVVVLDSSGNEILSATAEKSFASVLISAPGLEEGETYTVRTGGFETAVTLSSLICGTGTGMMGGGMMNGSGGQGQPGQGGMQPGGQSGMPGR